jgi:hypothetical protein
MSYTTPRKPLFSTMPQFFPLPSYGLGKKIATLYRSSLMHSVQSFEMDENCILLENFYSNGLLFAQTNQLTHIRISFWDFGQCVHLLNEIGSQLHSFTVTITRVFEHQSHLNTEISSVNNISRFDISMN